MINIFFTVFSEKLPASTWNYWLNMLTPAMQIQISKYRNWQDAQRSLLGKALLVWACRKLNFKESLPQNLASGTYYKPYFPAGPAFNISHSGNIVVCAISSTNNIGIDIEEIKPVPLTDFSDLFTVAELKTIFNAENDFAPFYTLWTQKEAFLKALGTGLHLPLKEIEVDNGIIRYNNVDWYTQQVAIRSGYVCSVATDQLGARFFTEEVVFHNNDY